jgi:hypothetical protein
MAAYHYLKMLIDSLHQNIHTRVATIVKDVLFQEIMGSDPVNDSYYFVVTSSESKFTFQLDLVGKLCFIIEIQMNPRSGTARTRRILTVIEETVK